MSATSQMPQDIEKVKYAGPVPGVPDMILKRWSPRAFADKSVSATDLKAVFTAAQWAASSYNEQPWRFIVGQRSATASAPGASEVDAVTDSSTYSLILGTLGEFNQAWVKSAPVLILSVARTRFAKNGHPNRHAMHDTGAATANLALAATSLGLSTHSMAGFDPEKARAAFHIPADYEPAAVTALGYCGDPESLEGELHEREVTPRERKPLGEIVFSGAWEKAAAL
jgi:nitroreductase